LSKQLNVMQTTSNRQLHPQFKRAVHQTQHVGVIRKSNAECKVYVKSCFDKVEMIINNVKYIMTSK